MIRAIVAALLLVGGNAFADSFGAIAYSPSTGQHGWSTGYDDRWRAEAAANGWCGVDDCRTVVWVGDRCAAMAIGRDGARWSWGMSESRGDALERALEECSARDVDCRVVRWICSR